MIPNHGGGAAESRLNIWFGVGMGLMCDIILYLYKSEAIVYKLQSLHKAEASDSGLFHHLGKVAYRKVSRVRISPPPLCVGESI